MFEEDGWPAIFILGLILLMCMHSWAQETCKHCPNQAQMAAQFPEAPQAHHAVFTKAFAAAELAHASAISLDAYLTVSREGKPCLEGNNGFPERVRGKELATEGAVEFGAVFAGSALLRFVGAPRHFGWTTFLPQAYGTALHARAAAQWLHC